MLPILIREFSFQLIFGTFFSILEVWYSNALLSLLLFDIHHGVEVDILEALILTTGFLDQNSAVYHDAADTNLQIDVSVLWTIVDKVLKLQRKVQNLKPVARFHSWRTELINACAQAFVTPSTNQTLLQHRRRHTQQCESQTGLAAKRVQISKMTTLKIHLSTTATTSRTGVCQHHLSADLQHHAADVTCEIFCGSHSGVQLPHFNVDSWYFQRRWSRKHGSDALATSSSVKTNWNHLDPASHGSRTTFSPKEDTGFKRSVVESDGQCENSTQQKRSAKRWCYRLGARLWSSSRMEPKPSVLFLSVQRSIGTWLATWQHDIGVPILADVGVRQTERTTQPSRLLEHKGIDLLW